MKAFIVSVSVKIYFSLFIVGLDIYLVYNRIFSTLIHRFVVQVKMKELSAMEMKEEVSTTFHYKTKQSEMMDFGKIRPLPAARRPGVK